MAKRFVAHRIPAVPSAQPPAPAAAATGHIRQRPPRPMATAPRELGGPTGPEPTRYGDWERKGICVDF